MAFRAGEIIYADDLNDAFGNTGVRGDLDITAATGWSILVDEYQIVGKLMQLRLQVERTGSAINANAYNAAAPGNIAGDPAVCTINDVTKRPTMQQFWIFQNSNCAGCLEINAGTGVLSVSDAYPSSSIATGNTIEISPMYMIP